MSNLLTLPLLLSFASATSAEPVQQKTRVADVLSRWERASAKLSSTTPAELDRAMRRHRSKLSAHEVTVAVDFRSTVSVKALRRKFQWTISKQTDDEIRLSAKPKDPVERLFYRRFELSLDAKTFLPKSIRFEHHGKQPTVSLGIRTNEPVQKNGIRLVTATSGAIREPQKLPGTKSEKQKRLQQVLRRWRETTSKARVIETGFYRYQYDLTFNVEKQGKGTFRFEDPNRFVFQIHPVKIDRNARSDRKTRNGKPFHLEAARRGTFAFDGKKLVTTDSAGKSSTWGTIDPKNPNRFKDYFFSKDVLVERVFGGWFPFFRPTQKDIESNFQWKIEKETKTEIWLEAIPRSKRVAVNMRSAKVILNKKTGLPNAIRVIDPTGHIETVYVFTKWITVPRGGK